VCTDLPFVCMHVTIFFTFYVLRVRFIIIIIIIKATNYIVCLLRRYLNDAAEISQVEEIMGLGRRWQKTLDRFLVQSQGGLDNRVDAVVKLGGKAGHI